MRLKGLVIQGFIIFIVLAAGKTGFSALSLHGVHFDEPRGPEVRKNQGTIYPDLCGACHAPHVISPDPSDACKVCHSPEGQFDGVDDPDIGAANNRGSDDANGNWISDIYDENGNLRPGKENWCLGCHDDGHSFINGVKAPNVAGRSTSGEWTSPVTIVDTGFSNAANLIDNNLTTGNTDGGASELIFDLGETAEISHLRFYTETNQNSLYDIYSSKDMVNWDKIVYGQRVIFGRTMVELKATTGWTEIRLDKFAQVQYSRIPATSESLSISVTEYPVRYIKMVKAFPSNLTTNSLREVQFKLDLQYGYLTSGHPVVCTDCHDIEQTHADTLARTYQADQNNYGLGYRLWDIQVDSEIVPSMEVPRVGINWRENPRTDNDFALCFSCHDKNLILGDITGQDDLFQDPLMTNFRSDNQLDNTGNIANEHLRHLRGRGRGGNAKDWDSDWDGVLDSPISCTACHNIHGSPSPAMMRHGELVSTPGTNDKAPMTNYMYQDANGKPDPNLMNPLVSTGGFTQFFYGGPGNPTKNNTCNMCHNDHMTHTRNYTDTEGSLLPPPTGEVIFPIFGLDIAVIPDTDDTARLSWTGLPSDFIPADFTYRIYWDVTTGVTPQTGNIIDPATSPYFHTGLTTGVTYYYIVTAIAGGVESDPTAEVAVTFSANSLGVALDAPELNWTTDGDANWYPQENVYVEGGSGAQSGEITHNQQTNLRTTLSGPGTLTFQWKASTEEDYWGFGCWDLCDFQLNGVTQMSIGCEYGFVPETITIPAGETEINWRYSRDEYGGGGQDACWVDAVTFTPDP